MNSITRTFKIAITYSIAYGLLLVGGFISAVLLEDRPTPGDLPPTLGAASGIQDVRQLLLNALPHVFYLGTIGVILMHGWQLPSKWRRSIPILSTLVIILLAGGILLGVLGESWQKHPEHMTKIVIVASFLTGSVFGLHHYFQEQRTKPDPRGWVEILGIHTAFFTGVGGIVALAF